MKLIVDANILFAALIKEGLTAELLISDKLQLFAPDFLLSEFSKYNDLTLKKTHRIEQDFKHFLELLKDQIIVVPKKEITPFMDEVDKISPDPKEIIYLALAIAINANIWSNDKKLNLNSLDIISKRFKYFCAFLRELSSKEIKIRRNNGPNINISFPSFSE